VRQVHVKDKNKQKRKPKSRSRKQRDEEDEEDDGDGEDEDCDDEENEPRITVEKLQKNFGERVAVTRSFLKQSYVVEDIIERMLHDQETIMEQLKDESIESAVFSNLLSGTRLVKLKTLQANKDMHKNGRNSKFFCSALVDAIFEDDIARMDSSKDAVENMKTAMIIMMQTAYKKKYGSFFVNQRYEKDLSEAILNRAVADATESAAAASAAEAAASAASAAASAARPPARGILAGLINRM
jgi:hypothetical protein